jgi:hypothetical protein
MIEKKSASDKVFRKRCNGNAGFSWVRAGLPLHYTHYPLMEMLVFRVRAGIP